MPKRTTKKRGIRREREREREKGMKHNGIYIMLLAAKFAKRKYRISKSKKICYDTTVDYGYLDDHIHLSLVLYVII